MAESCHRTFGRARGWNGSIVWRLWISGRSDSSVQIFSPDMLERRQCALGFNRSMQQIGEIVQRAFGSLVFFLGEH